MYIHVDEYICMNVHTCIRIDVDVKTCVHTLCIHVHIYTYRNVYIDKYIHVYIHV